ncbi:MAG TPA: heavy-metal-associated domain-containing protein [Anaerolineales bacterium]|nr:heavy-metal-associated domain-containing protein [Anaerolineales bacterium]
MGENYFVEPISKTTSTDQIRNADSALLAIKGIGCQNCATRVRNSLLALDGVFMVDIFLNMAMAEISYDSAKVSVEMLQDAVSRAGNDGRHHYRAELIAALYSSIQDEI